MAKKSRMGVLKRQREMRKAEKAAAKRERRTMNKETDEGARVATQDDLAGYGFAEEEEEEEAEERSAP